MLIPWWWVTQLLHILVIAPFLVYVGLARPGSPAVYWTLGLLGALLFFNFSRLLWTDGVRGWLVIHAFLFPSLFLYVAWRGEEATDIAFSLLIAIGSAAAGYHVIRMISSAVR